MDDVTLKLDGSNRGAMSKFNMFDKEGGTVKDIIASDATQPLIDFVGLYDIR